jgi:hypothetical protein
MSHSNYDDAIKNHGTRGAAHLHTYFGNTLTDYTSTYETLRSTGLGTCDGGPLNRTAYWFPAMINATNPAALKIKYPIAFQWYYINVEREHMTEIRSSVCTEPGLDLQDGRLAACAENAPYFLNQQPIRRLQRGQKIIFGYDPSGRSRADEQPGFPDVYDGPANNMLYNVWTCQQTNGTPVAGTYRYLHHRTSSSLGLTGNASCPASGIVSLRVESADCWNGELDHTDHYSHFSRSGNDGNGRQICPATHPYKHIHFTVILTWSYTGGISTAGNWYMSSDRHNGADFEPGETFHWDMMFAWNDTIMDFWAKNTMGMYPDPNDPSTYIYLSAGTDYVGGKHMRDFIIGGLGVDNIVPCDPLGTVFTHCSLKQHQNLGIGLTDVEADVPVNPGNTGKSKMH